METSSKAKMEKKYSMNHLLSREDNEVSSVKCQKKPNLFKNIWNNLTKTSNIIFSRINTSLSTMGNELINTSFNRNSVENSVENSIENSVEHKKAQLFTDKQHDFEIQTKKSSDIIHNTSYKNLEVVNEYKPFLIIDDEKSWYNYENDDDNYEIWSDTNETVENPAKNVNLNDVTSKDNATESHISSIHESSDNTDNTDNTEKKSNKKETVPHNINKDASMSDESFCIISDMTLDVSPQLAMDSIKKTPMHFFDTCQEVWNDETNQHNHSDESQKISYHDITYNRDINNQDNYETWHNVKIQSTTQNNLLNIKLNGFNNKNSNAKKAIIDDAQSIKQTTNSVKFESFNILTLNDKSLMQEETQEAVKSLLQMRISDSSIMIDKDSKSETFSEISEHISHEDSGRLQQLSKSSIDSKDNFCIISENESESETESTVNSTTFESSDISFMNDKSLMQKRIQQEAAKSIQVCISNSSITIDENSKSKISLETSKDTSCEDSARLRQLSESSVDSDDSFCIVFENESETEINTVNSITFESSDISSVKNKLPMPKESRQKVAKSSIQACIFDSSIDEDCKSETSFKTLKNISHKDSARLRQLSESSVDSNDSFCIVFESESETENMVNDCSEIDSNEDEDENEDEDSDGDSIDDQQMIDSEDNKNSKKSTIQTKKVQFDPAPPVVHIMIKWNYAYRAARKGPWEEIARDNERFRGRINSTAAVLNRVLTNQHRSQVWQTRFADQK